MIERSEYENDVVPGDDRIASLVDALANVDGVERHTARVKLEGIGPPAVPALARALQSPSEHARWEAAKALGEIADPRAAPALVQALEDEEPGVRWLAAEGLVALGRDGLEPLLQALEGGSDSVWLQAGAHQVLHTLVREGVADEVAPVLEALEDIEPAVEVPMASYNALMELRKQTGQRDEV